MIRYLLLIIFSSCPGVICAAGDIDNNSQVNFHDFALIAKSWHTQTGQPGFRTDCDLSPDGVIDARDMQTLAAEWLVHYNQTQIAIDANQKYQQIEGFGASLTESSAWLIQNAMSTSQRSALLTELFDPNVGIGLSYLRQPIGASDFRLDDYTCDDVPAGQSDYALDEFSIERDTLWIIPTLQQILSINDSVGIMATPWTAPAWMKTTGSLFSGSLKNEQPIYDTYANYFVSFIQAYRAYNIDIDTVTLQNEPHHEPWTYCGMKMEPADQIRLVKAMGPKFTNARIRTTILCWDHNWNEPDYPVAVLDDTQARTFLAGSAFHAYAGDVTSQSIVKAAHPDKDIYLTECSGGLWSTDFGSNLLWDTETLIIGATRNWAKTVLKWNLALDENNGPKIPGGCDNCRGVVTINSSTGEFSRQVEYYSLGHASKFVRPGARRIFSSETQNGLKNVAFENPDTSIVLISANSRHTPANLRIDLPARHFLYQLPPRSVTTFRWSPTSATVNSWTTRADQTQLLTPQPPSRLYPSHP